MASHVLQMEIMKKNELKEPVFNGAMNIFSCLKIRVRLNNNLEIKVIISGLP
jgi:hypothetical protein